VQCNIKSAAFTDFDTVAVRFDGGLSGAKLYIKDGDGGIVGIAVKESGKKADFSDSIELENGVRELTLLLSRELDFSVVYRAELEFGEERSSVEIKKHRLFDTAKFVEKYAYDGPLGAQYSSARTDFAVWSPTAERITLNIYDSGETTDTRRRSLSMTRGARGEWTATVEGDLDGKYYTYSAEHGGVTREVVDPYAKSAGRNGLRGMIINLAATNDGCSADFLTCGSSTADAMSRAVIYEAQLRDLTIHESSNVTVENRGKFLGLTERGAKDKPTPLDYLTELGVTAVHFQPLFDFASVDESFDVATYDKDGEYNWGYDPLNYNVPEGSYSSDPSDGAVRVKELKKMISALHGCGIAVVMDVVYNHVFDAEKSNFEALVPGYYFRMTDGGEYCNGSACGNETASERYMFRRFMIDSVCYWAREYKIDGFRFDLMGLHDIDTMNMIYAALAEIKPDVMLYGEGWTGGESGLSPKRRATVANAAKMPNIAVFDDIVRDGLKGSVFEPTDTGFVSGKPLAAVVYVGASGGTNAASGETYKALGRKAFARRPSQNVNYVSAHDNATLWDKLNASVNADKDALKAINRLAAVAVFTGQGAGFMLAGEEFLRSKPTETPNAYDNGETPYATDKSYYFSDNSYRSPDCVNAIDWRKARENADTVGFYKGLIDIKKSLPQFHIADKKTLEKCLFVRSGTETGHVAAYAVKAPDGCAFAVVIINASQSACVMPVPRGDYRVLAAGGKSFGAGKPVMTFSGDKYTLGARSSAVLTAELDEAAVKAWRDGKSISGEGDTAAAAKALGINMPNIIKL